MIAVEPDRFTAVVGPRGRPLITARIRPRVCRAELDTSRASSVRLTALGRSTCLRRASSQLLTNTALGCRLGQGRAPADARDLLNL
jgi:hypothetical protein